MTLDHSPRAGSGSAHGPAEDADLVARCLAADEEAWGALVARYADYVYAVASRGFHLSPDEAEEVLQDTMLQVYEHLADYRGTGALRAWIGTIAQNASRQRLRGRSRRGETALPDEIPDASQQRALDAVEEAFQTRSALAQLDLPCRQVLEQFFLGNRKYAEIASDLGIPAGTVASRISRCLVRLRRLLGGVSSGRKK
ncbi:MAG: RNA polymerase sigma factor [bacterium]